MRKTTRVRRSLERAVGIILAAVLLLTLIFSVALMFNAESENIKLINGLIRLGRGDEAIPLRVANSQLRIGMAQGLISIVLLGVTVYFAWQTRRSAQPAKDAELRMREERLRAEEVALETQKALAELAAFRQEMAVARRRWWWLR